MSLKDLPSEWKIFSSDACVKQLASCGQVTCGFLPKKSGGLSLIPLFLTRPAWSTGPADGCWVHSETVRLLADPSLRGGG